MGLIRYGIICILGSAAFLTTRPASAASAFFWLPRLDSSGTGDPAYTSNPGRGPVTYTRLGVGDYEVTFAGFPNTSHLLWQVTPYGVAGAECNATGFPARPGGAVVGVFCVDHRGVVLDTQFTLAINDTFTTPSDVGAVVYGVAASSYPPPGPPAVDFGFDGRGGATTVNQVGTGTYDVSFSGLTNTALGGTVNVMADGGGVGGKFCKPLYWGTGASGTSIRVQCWAHGNLIDSALRLRFGSASPINQWFSGAYVWADQPLTSSYTPNTYYQHSYKYGSSTSPGTLTAGRTSTGNYFVDIPGLSPGGGGPASNALVTAYGSGAVSCNLWYWAASPVVSGTRVYLSCSDALGAAVDSMFVLSYATTDAVL
jgi:hypothetical protein